MAGAQWIKLRTNLFEDLRIVSLKNQRKGDAYVLTWIRMMLLAGTINDEGHVCYLGNSHHTLKTLAKRFDVTESHMQKAIRTFMENNLLIKTSRGLKIRDWEEDQNVAGLRELKNGRKTKKKKEAGTSEAAVPAQPPEQIEQEIAANEAMLEELEEIPERKQRPEEPEFVNELQRELYYKKYRTDNRSRAKNGLTRVREI